MDIQIYMYTWMLYAMDKSLPCMDIYLLYNHTLVALYNLFHVYLSKTFRDKYVTHWNFLSAGLSTLQTNDNIKGATGHKNFYVLIFLVKAV